MGRQLASLSTGNKTYTYQYNSDGLRIQTSDGTTTARYTWVDGRLTSQTDGTDTLYFRYDENGNPLAVLHNGTEYYYVTNLQGDIIALLDGQGNCVVEYTYDAWGKVLSKTGSMATSLGADNPLRYRGYYYDQETGFYYLQSRYYDPATGRFINADDVSYLGASGTALSYNLFAYCENNPVIYCDHRGTILFAKYTVYLAGKTFLQAKGYNLAASMWHYAFYRGSYTYGKLCDSIAKSSTLKGEIKKYLAKFDKKGKNKAFDIPRSNKITVSFTSGDLLYAVGKMYLYIFGSYSKITNSFGESTYKNISSYYNMPSANAKKYINKSPIGYVYLWINFGDTYNFENWSNVPSFKNYANNLGIILQKTKVITPFDWSYSYSITYYVY